MKIAREELLAKLEAVAPGLAKRETVEQSQCVVFVDGRLWTYNVEVACSHEFKTDIVGAVHALPLMAVLRKMKEEIVTLDQEDGCIVVGGKGKKIEVRRQEDILLPIDSLQRPKAWAELDPEFVEAIGLVRQCAGKESDGFATACVNIAPDYVEACDNEHLMRFDVATGVRRPTLVRHESLAGIDGLDVTEIAETKTWLHLRNGDGLTYMCRRYFDNDFPDLDPLLEVSGEAVSFPGGLVDAAQRAEVFSSDVPDEADNNVIVQLKEGQLRIIGTGACGSYREQKRIAYEGPPLKFSIPPKMLADIVRRHHECVIGKGRLMVDGGKFTYVSCLGEVD